ncbi:CDK2-associated and cullin domain-containing protein 1 [Carassius auratus]|uniref:CDK2-associated and cullin domain-containing protein 1 n=1 Tax=Carassius auratus TaxID=7957 RepID=A0A6P6L6R9_CARAU|nr:CDK2-associated and cullin domain-containing protein 1 [Carassius auratus]XP_052429487.1 CDK2-associated and cullin domain-containing protein 1 [Carassius gibelio]
MEEMQGVEDDNHNCRAQAESVCSPTQVCVDHDSSSDTCESTSALLLNSTAKFHLNVMTAEEYKTVYWPKLERAIEHLLTQSPMDHISISYEQIYSQVYKCVCQQHSELLYNDLMWKIRSHLEQVSSELQAGPAEDLIENFNRALTRYTAALHCIVPVFIYMNKFYIETKLNRDLRDDLMKLFSDHVAEKHIGTLLPLLKKAHSMPFQVKPSTMESVVKGLYALRPDWVPLAPALFSRFIPQIHPPALESQLLFYADQDKKLQMELHQKGFSRGDQSRKRASEES